jgi:hypothetical protein
MKNANDRTMNSNTSGTVNTPSSPRALSQPLPPLPYGVANDTGSIAVHSVWSTAAVDAVNEHCRQIEFRRMTLALQQLQSQAPHSH